uniref:MORN repeat-containing protein 5 n=1 Tax=Clastoptera arizonana TaxID=38151 RepID=A0A1B6C510_9HEMI
MEETEIITKLQSEEREPGCEENASNEIGCNIDSKTDSFFSDSLEIRGTEDNLKSFMFNKKLKQDKSDDVDIKVRDLATGSKYIGEWSNCDMDGACCYVLPNGVIFEGKLRSGLFDGTCSLYYPNSGCFEGVWFDGELQKWKYTFSDGLVYSSEEDWPYLSSFDRRFWSEIERGLRPGEAEQITNQERARTLPVGLFDVGNGFYNPKDLSVTHPKTGEFIRVPSKEEIDWILEHCRKGGEANIGFQKSLYKDWFDLEGEEGNKIPECFKVKWTAAQHEAHKNRFKKIINRQIQDKIHDAKFHESNVYERSDSLKYAEEIERKMKERVKTIKDLVGLCQKWNKMSIDPLDLCKKWNNTIDEEGLIKDQSFESASVFFSEDVIKYYESEQTSNSHKVDRQYSF